MTDIDKFKNTFGLKKKMQHNDIPSDRKSNYERAKRIKFVIT